MANATSEVNAHLGRGSEFEGKLTFEGTVQIDGKFTGEIFSDDTLIIGEGAQVKAEIEVSTVIIYGDVVGNIKARNIVELHAPARLRGIISAGQLSIDKGVVFDGHCQMTGGREAERRETPPAPPRLSPPPNEGGGAARPKGEPAIL